jgi:hypothetical protein
MEAIQFKTAFLRIWRKTKYKNKANPRLGTYLKGFFNMQPRKSSLIECTRKVEAIHRLA